MPRLRKSQIQQVDGIQDGLQAYHHISLGGRLGDLGKSSAKAFPVIQADLAVFQHGQDQPLHTDVRDPCHEPQALVQCHLLGGQAVLDDKIVAD